MEYYTYLGRGVKIAAHADISPEMKPDGVFGELVQAVLDGTKKWSGRRGVIETLEVHLHIIPMAVPVGNARVKWGIHRRHQAQKPGLSPFVDVLPGSDLLGWLTIELVGPWYAPQLTRAYGGDYTPPLPWMVSAREVDGGKAFCREYWRNHAYLDQSPTLIRRGTETDLPPAWYSVR